MRDVGMGLSCRQKALAASDLPGASNAVIMGCIDREACPALHVKGAADWSIPDPKGKALEEVRVIRDNIESKVRELAAELE